jgi:LPS O-antigen subunit length determinant protein (WzzB/FepE family)
VNLKALLFDTKPHVRTKNHFRNYFIEFEFVLIDVRFNSKQTSIEIEQLNARVVEAETKLKTEVVRIKKKLQIQITELELSLDVANKSNIDLQKTIKKQSDSNPNTRQIDQSA